MSEIRFSGTSRPEAAEPLGSWGPCGLGPGVSAVTSGDKRPVTSVLLSHDNGEREVERASPE